MRTFLLAAATVVATAAPGAPLAAQSSPVVGVWEGSLDLPNGASLRLVFHIDAPDGALAGTWDSPDQGATGLPATAVRFAADTLTFEMGSVGASFTGVLSGDELSGTFRQGGLELPLTLARVSEPSRPDRPQEPEPPFPYHVEEVTVDNAEAGVTLAGTLTLPEGSGPFPGVILVTGSGPQNRDEALMGHRPFLVLADYLTRRGIAVLRYDDRGVGASTGSFATATSEDLASDAAAALRWLRARREVADDAVGIVGHSEGGLIGPMVAARGGDANFVVMLAGPGLKGLDIILLQSRLIAQASGVPEEMIELNTRTQQRLADIVASEPDPDAAEPLLRAVLEEARAALPAERQGTDEEAASAFDTQIRQVNSPWFRFFLHYDPAPTLRQVTVPVLALLGEKDLQVPAEANRPAIEAALAANPDATVMVLPGLNHLFQTATTGAPAEYGTITETMSPTALAAVADWILERFGPSS